MKKFVKVLCSTIVMTSMLIGSISSVFANQSQVVKVSIGSTTASVNGYDTNLSVAPYIQKSSGSMMIPLRFVSTALGIPEDNIIYNANEKTITINYNGTNAKFLVGTDKVYINGKRFTMYVNDIYTSCTEIKNGNTFIPLRSLETLFGIKIDWVNETKTAILTNQTEDNKITNQVVQQPIEEEPIVENTINSLTENTKAVEEQNTVKTFKDYTDEEVRAMEEEVVRLVNEERIKYGLQPLVINETLMKLSREKSEDMYTNNYFSHISERLGAPADVIRSNNLEFSWMGENIAKMQTTPSEVVQAWMNSKGHRENILSPNAKYIGVGYFGGIQDIQVNSYKGIEIKKDYVPYWTQQFIG